MLTSDSQHGFTDIFKRWPKHSWAGAGTVLLGVSLMFTGHLLGDAIGILVIFVAGLTFIRICSNQRALGKGAERRRGWQLALAVTLLAAAATVAGHQTVADLNRQQPKQLRAEIPAAASKPRVVPTPPELAVKDDSRPLSARSASRLPVKPAPTPAASSPASSTIGDAAVGVTDHEFERHDPHGVTLKLAFENFAKPTTARVTQFRMLVDSVPRKTSLDTPKISLAPRERKWVQVEPQALPLDLFDAIWNGTRILEVALQLEYGEAIAFDYEGRFNALTKRFDIRRSESRRLASPAANEQPKSRLGENLGSGESLVITVLPAPKPDADNYVTVVRRTIGEQEVDLVRRYSYLYFDPPKRAVTQKELPVTLDVGNGDIVVKKFTERGVVLDGQVPSNVSFRIYTMD